MGFFTKEGIVWIGALCVMYASVTGYIQPAWFSAVAGLASVAYTLWYFHFCYMEAQRNCPEMKYKLYNELGGSK